MPLSIALAATCTPPELFLVQPILGGAFGFLQIGLLGFYAFLGERYLPGSWINWIVRGALGLAAAITGGAIGVTIWIWRLQNLVLATWCATDDAGRDLLHDRVNMAILARGAAMMAPLSLMTITGFINAAMGITRYLRLKRGQAYAVPFAPWGMPPRM